VEGVPELCPSRARRVLDARVARADVDARLVLRQRSLDSHRRAVGVLRVEAEAVPLLGHRGVGPVDLWERVGGGESPRDVPDVLARPGRVAGRSALAAGGLAVV